MTTKEHIVLAVTTEEYLLIREALWEYHQTQAQRENYDLVNRADKLRDDLGKYGHREGGKVLAEF